MFTSYHQVVVSSLDQQPTGRALFGTHNTFGDRTFAAAGTPLWDCLPPALRAPSTM